MKRKFVATFTGHEAIMTKPIKIKELMLTSFQLALAFPNISTDLRTNMLFYNGNPITFATSIITTVDDLVDMLNAGLGSVLVTYDEQTKKLTFAIGAADTIFFYRNLGSICGFEGGTTTTGPITGPYPVSLIPFKSIGVNFGGMIATGDFQTITGESFDLIVPCNDKNFKENLVFYDREAFDNAIVSFRPSGGQINSLKMWLSVYLGGIYRPVNLPASYQSEFTFHITED